MVYLAKGGFWLSLGSIASHISVFIIAIAFANLLPKEVYGTYKYIISVATILSFFTLQGMAESIIQSVARGYEQTFIQATKMKVRWGLVGSFVGLGIAAYYFVNENMMLATAFLIVAAFVPIWNTFNVYNSLLAGRRRFDISTKYHLASQLFILIATVSALLLTDNLFILLIVFFSSWTMVRIFFYIRTLKKYPLNKEVDVDAISFGKHLTLSRAPSAIAEQLDKVLLWHFLGPIAVATYFFALAPVKVLAEPLKNVAALALPKLSTADVNGVKKTLIGRILLLSLFFIPIVGLYIYFAPYVYALVFPQYLDAVLYSQLFALSLLLAPKIFIRQTLVAKKKKREIYQLQTIVPLVKIGLLLTLLPPYGLLGAVVALLLVDMTNFLLNLYLFRKI
tara:strand:+ start:15303 stop:16484 length:1182 start_codon:yes stop_codon:yes gene_type:complete